MEVILNKKIKENTTLIEGFPGIGLVGTIATEFLVNHLKAKEVGSIKGPEVPPMIAVHDNKIVKPMTFFYDKKHNLLILHVLSGIPKQEWNIADLLAKQAKKLKCKEIISLESVGVPGLIGGKTRSFFFTNDNKKAAMFKKMGLEPLKEGIIIGVTGALMMNPGIKLSCIFAETHSRLPDSKAAAKIVEVLNKHLKLNVSTKPLFDSAAKFESKLNELISASRDASKKTESKNLSYMG